MGILLARTGKERSRRIGIEELDFQCVGIDIGGEQGRNEVRCGDTSEHWALQRAPLFHATDTTRLGACSVVWSDLPSQPSQAI